VRAVDLGAVADVEDVDGAGIFVDPVDDPVGAAPGSVTAGQRAEQRFADPVRVDRRQRTYRDGINAPYKRGATGSNPVAPTRQNNLVTVVPIRH
jgi:hypothetical protein